MNQTLTYYTAKRSQELARRISTCRPFGSGRAEDNENKINLTPMLDVVFITLIFFIITATFVKEVGLDVNQPDDDKPKTVDPDKKVS